MSSWLSKYELKEQIYVNKNRKLNTNSGFDVSVRYLSLTDIDEEIQVIRDVNLIKISNIDNINYIDSLNNIYIIHYFDV